MCPVPEAFESILGRFEPTGKCPKCARVGWNMTNGLCVEHFRTDVLDRRQHDVDDLWDIHDLIVYKETLTDRPRPAPAVVPPSAVGRSASRSVKPPLIDEDY